MRLDDSRFVGDEGHIEIDQIFAYLHRLGSFCIDDALGAEGRTAVALTRGDSNPGPFITSLVLEAGDGRSG